MNVFDEFKKRKEFLVCIDSDGCAMDTMDCKHFYCFGPCLVEEWQLGKWKAEILEYWNQLNLYTMTRGINRFLGLAMALEYVNRTFCEIPEIVDFSAWISEADELSNSSVGEAYKQTGKEIFRKALSWSESVNRAITQLPEEVKKPFAGANQGVQAAHRAADVAIVSSANREAVQEEWQRFDMLDAVDICLTQSEGSKAYCIGQMLKKGYAPDHVLMVGDAPGDKKAAEKNGVLFYPILVRHEGESWELFQEEALSRFLEGSYQGDYEEELEKCFLKNLS